MAVQQLPPPKQEYDPFIMQQIVRMLNERFARDDSEQKPDAIGKMLVADWMSD